MRLLLIRHGQTPANIAGELDTAVPGLPLSPLGLKQAAALPSGLRERELGDVGSIAVSTLVRTQMTAAPLAEATGLTPVILDGLKEIQAGDLEMKDDHESQGLYNATCLAWARGDLDLRMPGGETGHDFFGRYDAAVAAATGETGTAVSTPVVVVSHGAAIRTWVAARAVETRGDFAASHQLLNTGLAHLERVDDPSAADAAAGRRWRLVEWIGDPIGGPGLQDAFADDPTGRATE